MKQADRSAGWLHRRLRQRNRPVAFLGLLVSILLFQTGETALAQQGGLQQPLPVAPESVPPAGAQPVAGGQPPVRLDASVDFDEMLSPGGLPATLRIMLMMTVLSLAPSLLIMTTCFIRFVIVFGLLRQALGTQQLPPNQVLVSLSLFLTLLIMRPVWERAWDEGLKPYTENQPVPGLEPGEDPLERTFLNTARPLREFMSLQIERTGNSDAVWMLLETTTSEAEADRLFADPENPAYDEVPLTVLVPAYMLSELKTAFVIGFQIYIPFLVLDMVVSSILVSMGMMMLPPVFIALPFKLLLFVMIDGWYLTVGTLLRSVAPLSSA